MNQIDYLWKLQGIENNIQKEKNILESIMKAKEIGEKIKEHKKFKNIYEYKKEKTQDKKNQLRKLEHDHSEMEYNKEGIKEKLYGGQVTDLKQLESLLKEQEKLEEEIELTDSKILEIMEELESAEEEINTMGIEERRMGSLIKKMFEDRKMTINDIEQRITKQIEEKEKLFKKIDKKYMEKYMEIKAKRSNPIAIIETDICTGCHMDLPIMVISKLKTQEIVICSNCGRILYVRDEA